MTDGKTALATDIVVLNPVDDQIYRALRQEIIKGELAPDSILRLRDIAERFNVSTTPVREALDRLKSNGLCTQVPHRGARVVKLSLNEFEDIYAVRMGLESEGVRRGLRQISETGLVQTRANWLEARSLWDSGGEPSLDQYLPRMSQIYTPCFEAANMPRLLGLILDYRRYAERYLRVALTDLEVLQDDVVLHENFVLACEQRDVELADETLRTSLGWTVHKVRERLQG